MWRFLHPTTKKRDGEINSFFHARLKSSGDAEEIFLKTVEITRIFNSFGLLCRRCVQYLYSQYESC